MKTAKECEETIPLVSTASSVQQALTAHPVKEKFLWRFEYRKDACLRFLSHLDLTAVITRALSASGTDLAYSEGFRVHPKVSFGPPLPLGVSGEGELFDSAVIGNTPPNESQINRFLPHGCEILSAHKISPAAKSLNAAITAGMYRFGFFAQIDPDEAMEAVGRILSSKQLLILPERKGRIKEKDIRPLIYSIECNLHDGLLYIDAMMSMLPGATCRPVELVGVLFPGRRFSDFSITRTGCFCRDKQRFVALI
jgi:radical SAM-linked protein